MNWGVKTSKSWWQCSWLKCNCKSQLFFMSERPGKFSKSTVEAVRACSSLQHSGIKGTSGSAWLLWMLSSLQLLSLSCFALPGASCILRGLKEGQTLWPRALPLPVAPCTNTLPVKWHTRTCTQGCHAQPMLLESRDEHGMGTCNASFRQTGSL